MANVQVSVQKIDINPVVDIVVTPVAKDAQGNYVRAIRFLGAPQDGAIGPTLLLEVVARGLNAEDIDIAIPATTF
jgi:predicted LPLAT superfamily acyltransferase